MSELSLVSTELREPYAPRRCTIVKRLESEVRDDLALVRIDPPLPKETYDTEEDVDWLILASRFEGESLFSDPEGSVAVYICRSKSPVNHDSHKIASRELEILDWGELQVNGVV